ncbi:MAG: hypothetical protein K8H87_07475, partial [Pseudorhodoplanes sp.]|nr:hypothetical protein [Pseudorhodoplanes sp.]
GKDISCNLGSLNSAAAMDSENFGRTIENAIRALTAVSDMSDIACVPSIARGMLEDIAHRLVGGAVTRSRSVKADNLREGDIAVALGQLQDRYPHVSIGSYPYFLEVQDGEVKRGTHLVARSTDDGALDAVIAEIAAMVAALGFDGRIDPAD